MTMENQSFGQHLTELRKRLTWSAVVVAMATAVAFVFHQQILTVLMVPADGFTQTSNYKPVYTELTEFIGIAMKASLLVGIAISFPFLLWQLVRFVTPGLNSAERRYLYILMPLSTCVFFAGCCFGYFVLFPPAVKFLLSFGSDVATPMIRIGNYVNLARNRRWAILGAFVLGALITPTLDPVNQSLVALPIIVLYEVSIQLSKVGYKIRKKSKLSEKNS